MAVTLKNTVREALTIGLAALEQDLDDANAGDLPAAHIVGIAAAHETVQEALAALPTDGLIISAEDVARLRFRIDVLALGGGNNGCDAHHEALTLLGGGA